MPKVKKWMISNRHIVLCKFKKRHHLRLGNIVGEEMGAKRVDPGAVADFQTPMKEKLQNMA